MFSLLLICFECNLAAVRVKLRKNFGFLFSFAGRTLFLVFTATISMASGWTWGYILGVITICNAAFNAIVLKQHPAFHKEGSRFHWMSDPTQKYTAAAEEGRMFMKSNPELASRAFSGAVALGAANPDLAASVASAAVAGAAEGGGAMDEPAGLPDDSDPFA
jgi:hypothetical protein